MNTGSRRQIIHGRRTKLFGEKLRRKLRENRGYIKHIKYGITGHLIKAVGNNKTFRVNIYWHRTVSKTPFASTSNN